MNAKPNIILITVDSLRVDHLGTYGYSRETSRNIDLLAKNGTKFTMAFTHGGGTSEAFPTMLSGVPPPANIQQCDMGMRRGVSIARAVKEYGYSTGAFNSNPYLSEYWGYSDGFDRFYHNLKGDVERRHTVTGSGVGPYLRLITGKPPIIQGREITENAISWIGSAHTPFFAWLHYMDVHMPYLPPSEFVEALDASPKNHLYMLWLYRKMYESNKRVYNSMDASQSGLGTKEISRITDYYDGAIRYVDSCVGGLVYALRARGCLQDTIIIFTADHGELIGEHGLVDHGFLYDQLLHVPMIISGRGIENRVVDSPTTHLFVQATIKASASGQESPQARIERDFADPDRGIISSVVDIARNTYSCRTLYWKYILTLDGHSKEISSQLYDLRNDARETSDVSKTHGDLVGMFRNRILDFIKNNSNVQPYVMPAYSKSEEQEVQRRLRDLGYE